MARTSNTAGLEDLVCGPYCWTVVTYTGFLRDSYDNVIKAEVERLQNDEIARRKQAELANNKQNVNGTAKNCQKASNLNENFDVKVAKVVQQLVCESDQVLGNENWTDLIGVELWNILKLDEYGKDRYKLDKEKDDSAALKKKSVVQLLKFIRNKISHIRTCKDEVKGKLKQFFDKDDTDQYHFNENKFVAFWISKFPKLVPYVWLKLYKFRNKLVNYYPDSEIPISQFEGSLLDLNKLEKKLHVSLIADMEAGNVLRRFEGPGYSLEFRGLPNLMRTPDKNVCIKVAVNSNDKLSLSVSHSSTIQDQLEYLGASPPKEELIIIFANNITDNEIWKYCCNCDCRVIVFCDPDKLKSEKIEEAVGKFKNENDLTVELTKCPIRGNELSLEKQEWVYEKGQVFMQGKYMKIKDIIPNSNILLEEISGNTLNKILKQEKPVFCENYKYPDCTGVYLKRKIYFTDAHGKKHVSTMNEQVKKENDIYETEILEKFHTKDMIPKHVCGKCVEPVKNPRKSDVFEESEFLKRIHRKHITSTYVLAESGMGKSNLLVNLGKTLKNSMVIFCSFRNFVSLVKSRVGNEDISKTDIKYVILQILGCTDPCERNMIDKWLEQKSNKGAKIDLQLDGLDEVPSGNLKLALKALEIIEKYLHAIRLWISSSKTFPKAEREFRFTYCSISPFLLRDKVDFFKQACRAKDDELTEEKLDSISLCLEFKFISDKEFTGFLDYPLNYSMLFELYEDNITELAMLNARGVGVELFESLYQKKFEIMYQEKKGVTQFDNEEFEMEKEMYLQLYTHLALVHLFPGVGDQFVPPFGVLFFTKDNYHKMGIITNNEPITFIHLKYADFLVAKFIMKVLETGLSRVLCPEQLFLDILSFGTPEKEDQQYRTFIWTFVDEFLEKISDFNRLKWFETHIKSNNLNRMSTEKNIGRFLMRAFNCELWNVARLLINLWLNETDIDFCNKILFVALISKAPSNWMISMCEKLSFDNHFDLIAFSVRLGYYDVAKYLIGEKCKDDVFDKIAEKRKNGGGILHCIVDIITQNHSHATFLQVLHENFVKTTIDFIKYVLGKSSGEIERKDARGRNFLLALPVIEDKRESIITSEHIFQLKEFIINELNADINDTSFDGDTVMRIGVNLNHRHENICKSGCLFKNCKRKTDTEKVEVYHKTLALVTSKNFAHLNLKSKGAGLTVLGEAVHFFGSDLREKTLELFRDAGANFNELDGEGDTILHYCVKNCDDTEFIKMLVEYGSKIDVRNGKQLCALCLAIKRRKDELVKFFRRKLKLKRKQKCLLNCGNELERTHY